MSGKVELKPEETLDDLILGGLKIIQPKTGYRFSLDAILLAHFSPIDKVKQVVDLGTGNGVIPLLLTYRSPHLKIKGMEIQPQMVERARRSVELNHLADRVEIVNLDIRKLKEVDRGGYADLVVCNPPFYKSGQGRVSLNQEEAIARHELAISMPEIISMANYLLTGNGKIALIQKADRLLEITNLLRANQINPTKIRLVHSKITSEAKLVLIEGRKNSGTNLKLMPPLIIYQPNDGYSDEIKAWYSDSLTINRL